MGLTTNLSVSIDLMELTGVEPVSALVISTSLVHRFSLSNPQGGNRSLSRTMGCSGKVLASDRPEAAR
jgi:hypothetical protein